MTEPNLVPPNIPQARALPKQQRRFSLVWIIPIIAIAIGGFLGIRAVLRSGPSITLHFKTAEGLEAGKTKIKYKNVDIGTVKTITLDNETNSVEVDAEMVSQATKLLVDDTRFWVVRPRVAGGQISGLGTLLSGAYIGVDGGKSTESRRDFKGLDVPPAVTADEPGKEFKLRGADLGSLDIGSPVYFRRIQVGEVVAYALDEDGKGVTASIFVHAPYDRFVTANTRFWQASGLDVSVDAGGVRLQTESLVSILLGGIAFEAPADEEPGQVAAANISYRLFDARDAAMKRPESEMIQMIAYFKESLRGLSPGAPIDFRGIVVGEVRSIDVEYDRENKEFRFPVGLSLYGDKWLRARTHGRNNGKEGSANNVVLDAKNLLTRQVERGLRAQLQSGNLLTGQRYVSLDFIPNAPPAKLDPNATLLELPTMGSSIGELQVTLGNIAKSLEKVPFDQIAADVRATMKMLNRTLESTDKLIRNVDTQVAPQLVQTVQEARNAMQAANRLLESDAPVQQNAREAMRELSRAAQSLRELADYLQRHPESLIRGKPEQKASSNDATRDSSSQGAP